MSPMIATNGAARNTLRGPDFFWSDFYLTKWFALSERLRLRFDVQCFNIFNHPTFALSRSLCLKSH